MRQLETVTDKAYKICEILGRNYPSYESIENIVKVINPVKDIETAYNEILKILKYRFEVSDTNRQAVLFILNKITVKEKKKEELEKKGLMAMLYSKRKDIAKLRELGQPYAYIASLYGVSWQTLKNFCVNYNIKKAGN